MAEKHWIKEATAKMEKGALHEEMGVAPGKKIPEKREEQAAHSEDPKLRERAQFALNLRHVNKG